MLRSIGISRKSAALIVRYGQKKKSISIVFYCSGNLSIAHNLGTTGSIQAGFSAKCSSPNEHLNQIENWKCHMCEFQLISQDRITNDWCSVLWQDHLACMFYSLIFLPSVLCSKPSGKFKDRDTRYVLLTGRKTISVNTCNFW